MEGLERRINQQSFSSESLYCQLVSMRDLEFLNFMLNMVRSDEDRDVFHACGYVAAKIAGLLL